MRRASKCTVHANSNLYCNGSPWANKIYHCLQLQNNWLLLSCTRWSMTCWTVCSVNGLLDFFPQRAISSRRSSLGTFQSGSIPESVGHHRQNPSEHMSSFLQCFGYYECEDDSISHQWHHIILSIQIAMCVLGWCWIFKEMQWCIARHQQKAPQLFNVTSAQDMDRKAESF